jgi:hypothetical protein
MLLGGELAEAVSAGHPWRGEIVVAIVKMCKLRRLFILRGSLTIF